MIEEADGFAQVFPEHKYAIVKALQERGHLVGMTGDGVNDAPALKQADVGIAVSGATDAARAAAGLILTAPGLSVIIKGIEEARRIFERMMSYTLYRIAMTLDIMVFIVLGDHRLRLLPVDAGDDHHAGAAGRRADHDDRLRQCGCAAAAGSLGHGPRAGQGFLGPRRARGRRKASACSYIGHNSSRSSMPQTLQTLLFLQLVVGGHLMLFRDPRQGPLWRRPYPAAPRSSGRSSATQVVAALICGFGCLVPALSWELIGLVWLYNLAWMVCRRDEMCAYRELERRSRQSTPFLARLKHAAACAARPRELSRLSSRQSFMDYRKRFLVKPERKTPPRAHRSVLSGAIMRQHKAPPGRTDLYLQKLTRLQSLLYAEKRHSMLIVLQALDAAGKDGTINHVFAAFNPQGCPVPASSSRHPTELAHDFLWRIHPHTPRRGRDRDLQPLPLRGCAGHPRAQADRQGDLDRALRPDPRFRGGARRTAARRSSSSSCTSARRNSSRASRSG